MIRVLVVDDTPSMRKLVADILGADPDLNVVGCADGGDEALRMTQERRPDVITMDLHMPDVDGFEATRRIMQTCPTPIVVLSGSGSRQEMDAGFRAVEAGALAIVGRPTAPGDQAAATLIRTLKAMAEVRVVRRWAQRLAQGPRAGGEARAARRPLARLVAIGASTGGPTVLRDILAELGPDYPLPVVIVQHMSAGFHDGFAKWLAAASGLRVRIALHGEHLAGRCAYLAPDGHQIGVTRDLRVALVAGPPEHGMCPAVSHMFRSIHPELRAATVAVLLTGMGKDGAQELRQLKDDGAVTIVQDRASAAVYGMPGEALRQDAAKLVLQPSEIGKTLAAVARDPDGLPFLSD